MPRNQHPARPTRPRMAVVLLAVLAALVSSVFSTSLLMRPALSPQAFAVSRDVPTVSPADPEAEPAGLHLILLPHPDDELSSWTSLLEAEDLRPVLVLLTNGEETRRCTPQLMHKHLQADLGEVAPDPDPTAEGRGSPACGEARLGSFRRAMTEAATHTPSVQLDWSTSRVMEVPGGQGRVVTGPTAVLIELDLGDGTLTANGVATVVRDMLASEDSGLGDLPLVRITSSAYYATDQAPAAGCDSLALCPPGQGPYVYDHSDHLAAREAARALAPLTQEGSWLVTNSYDPRATRHLALSEEVYANFMDLGAGAPGKAQRLGSHQRIYGWLAFPDAWRPGDLPLQQDKVIMPRVQSYEVVPP